MIIPDELNAKTAKDSKEPHTWKIPLPYRSSHDEKPQKTPQHNICQTDFPQFVLFPPEIKNMVWKAFMEDYQENPSVIWPVIWLIKDKESDEPGLVPFIDLLTHRLNISTNGTRYLTSPRPISCVNRHSHRRNHTLRERPANPLLSACYSSRVIARQRYAIIRAKVAIGQRSLSIITRPEHDVFYSVTTNISNGHGQFGKKTVETIKAAKPTVSFRHIFVPNSLHGSQNNPRFEISRMDAWILDQLLRQAETVALSWLYKPLPGDSAVDYAGLGSWLPDGVLRTDVIRSSGCLDSSTDRLGPITKLPYFSRSGYSKYLLRLSLTNL